MKEIDKLPFLFPDFAGVEERNISKMQLKRAPGGYKVGVETSLRLILTNVAYIGWATWGGEVVNKKHHPPIIPENTFWKVYNSLVDTTPDSLPTGRVHTTHYTQQRYPDDVGLLKERISSCLFNMVYVRRYAQGQAQPHYTVSTQKGYWRLSLCVQCSVVDGLVVTRMLEHPEKTDEYDSYQNANDDVAKKQQRAVEQLTSQLQTLDQELDAIPLSLSKQGLHPKLRSALEERFAALVEQRTVLERERKSALEGMSQQELLDFASLLAYIRGSWEGLPFEKKRQMVNILIKNCWLDPMAPHWYRIRVEWRNPCWPTEETYQYRRRHKTMWTEKENELLRATYPQGTRTELCNMLPTHGWAAIYRRALDLGLERDCPRDAYITSPHLSVEDLAFMEEKGIMLNDKETPWFSLAL